MTPVQQTAKIAKIRVYLEKVRNNLKMSEGPKQDFWTRELRKAEADLDRLTK